MGAETGTEGEEGPGEEYRREAKHAQKTPRHGGQNRLPNQDMKETLNSGEEGDPSATSSRSHEHEDRRRRRNNQQTRKLSPTRSGARSASEVTTLDEMQCHFQPEMGGI